jgi:wobble nucleotide-excising tRNase
VSPNGDEDREIKLADKVRKKIAEIERHNWQKLNDVETTFTGKVNLQSISVKDKRDEAKKIVEDALREVVDDYGVYLDIWISVALMVNGLGGTISFRI